MTAENRVLALDRAMETALRVLAGQGTAAQPVNLSEIYGDITSGATIFYRWLEGPVFLFLTIDPTTFNQDAPEGPGVPTVMKGPAMAQITDLQQYTASVGEVDSKQQPVTGDNLAWSIDNPAVASITPSADGYSALIVGLTDGTANYTVTDSTVTPPLTGSGSVTVVSSAATSLTVTEGTPEAQPPAAPPAAPPA